MCVDAWYVWVKKISVDELDEQDECRDIYEFEWWRLVWGCECK